MKQLLLLVLANLILTSTQLSANATLIVDATDKTCLKMLSSHVNVSVVNQVATVKSTQTFINQFDTAVHVKFAFPMYEDAAATGLRWKIYGEWYSAVFAAAPADTTLPGAGEEIDFQLEEYLGDATLFFELLDSILPDSTVVFELTYVQLLHYAYDQVSFDFPNDYSMIQTDNIDSQTLSIHIISDRTIVGTEMISHPYIINSFSDYAADLYVALIDQPANADYNYLYTLNATELGLFSFSTFLADSINYCDEYGRGYFGFIVEPDPGDSVVIEKVFTLIIDQSGSMGGDKIAQARDAATFIVDNLNEGDKFNIVAFESDVHTLFADHVPVTITNQNVAFDYIDGLEAGGGTNISGSFEMAIPQFADADPDVANIIVFLTDGQASAGITGTMEILDLIASLIITNDVVGLSINTFGIGYDANESLLNQIATENNGVSEFFAAGDLIAVITDFYLTIQSPVLLNTSMTFSPDIVHQLFPDPLPNLYKGHQLVVVGRYFEPGVVNVTFTGEKYGAIVNYEYTFELTDSTIEQNTFLTKLWAIEKINNLMNEYYSYEPLSPEADSIQYFVTTLSICYSVVSPFTSFNDNTGTGAVSISEYEEVDTKLKAINYPNPFRNSTTIQFLAPALNQIVSCVILDINGNIISILDIFINAEGKYEIIWDGKNSYGNNAIPGFYPYYIKIDETTIYGVMEKL